MPFLSITRLILVRRSAFFFRCLRTPLKGNSQKTCYPPFFRLFRVFRVFRGSFFVCFVVLPRERVRSSCGTACRLLVGSWVSFFVRRTQAGCTHVRVDLRCRETLVAKQFLDAADVGSSVHQMSGKAVTQCMW